MTSQIEEVNIDELKARAKELNVPGWQATKDPAKLAQKIADAEKGEKSIAPMFNVTLTGDGTRNSIITDLEKANPGRKYLTQNASLTASQAKIKGVEIAKAENGEIINCGEDIVCFTDEASYYKWQNDRNSKSLQGMKSIDKDLSDKHGGKRIQSRKENVREAFELDDD